VLFAIGYRKHPENLRDYPSLPFTIVPSFLERLFRVLCVERPPELQPTFNRLPTSANSSYGLLAEGIQTGSLERWRDVLDADAVARIEAETLELDAAVRAAATPVH
jgi:hypothetical protein